MATIETELTEAAPDPRIARNRDLNQAPTIDTRFKAVIAMVYIIVNTALVIAVPVGIWRTIQWGVTTRGVFLGLARYATFDAVRAVFDSIRTLPGPYSNPTGQ